MKITAAISQSRSPNIKYLTRQVTKAEDIFLTSENSLIDTYGIDNSSRGIDFYAFNLDTMSGNNDVGRFLKYVLSLKGRFYFLSTLLEDCGGFYMPSLPVISDGRIIHRRRKFVYGAFYVKDLVTSARILVGEELANEVLNAEKRVGPIYLSLEPYKSVYQAVKEAGFKAALKSLVSFDIFGHRVLPVICNEFPMITKYYKGGVIDMILHSCSNCFHSETERRETYMKWFKDLYKEGIIDNDLTIIAVESGVSQAKHAYKFKGSRLACISANSKGIIEI